MGGIRIGMDGATWVIQLPSLRHTERGTMLILLIDVAARIMANLEIRLYCMPQCDLEAQHYKTFRLFFLMQS